MNTPPASAAPALNGITQLTDWGVIRAQGADAAAFLHGQLTQDFLLLGSNEARLAAYCNAKGRIQASFIGFKRAQDDILLCTPQDLLAQTLKRLRMFVLRAQVQLSDASADWTLWGLVGDSVPRELASRSPWATLPANAAGAPTLVALPGSVGLARALWCTPAQAQPPAGPALPADQWHWLEVRSGVAMVTAPVFEAFVPQMLNYESVGGVNFKKGCYPGQEVVARSQFRGTLKRRAYLLHGATSLQPGQEVFHPSDAEQSCGTVVAAAPHPTEGWDAVVSMLVSAADGQTLRVGAAEGPALDALPLPYRLLDDI